MRDHAFFLTSDMRCMPLNKLKEPPGHCILTGQQLGIKHSLHARGADDGAQSGVSVGHVAGQLDVAEAGL